MIDDIWMGSEKSYYELKTRLDANMAVRPESVDEDNPIQLEVVDGIAIASISGPMVATSNWITQYLGIVSYQDIQEALASLEKEKDVKAILFDYDTPGGQAKGCRQCANFIREYAEKVKPVYSYSGGQVASAGMWLYSAGLYHGIDEDAQAGSVGVIMVHSDLHQMRLNEGIKDTIFRSAPYKALGHPLEPLSEEATKQIQEELDYLHDQFVTGISDLSDIPKDKVAKNIANGKMYRSREAVKLGLADAVLPLGKMIAKVSAQHRPAASSAATKRKA